MDERLNGTERRFAISRNSRWVPKAPDASKSYDDPNAMYSDWYGWQTTLNHEQKINDNLSWFLNAGMNDMTNRRMIYKSQIMIDDMGTIIEKNKKGETIKGAKIWSQYFLLKNKYAQAGLKWKVHTGAVEHNLVFSVDRSHRIMYNNNTHMDKPGDHVSGNIYTGIRFDPSIYDFDNAYSLGKMFMYQEMDTSLNFMDTMKAGNGLFWRLALVVMEITEARKRIITSKTTSSLRLSVFLISQMKICLSMAPMQNLLREAYRFPTQIIRIMVKSWML